MQQNEQTEIDGEPRSSTILLYELPQRAQNSLPHGQEHGDRRNQLDLGTHYRRDEDLAISARLGIPSLLRHSQCLVAADSFRARLHPNRDPEFQERTEESPFILVLELMLVISVSSSWGKLLTSAFVDASTAAM